MYLRFTSTLNPIIITRSRFTRFRETRAQLGRNAMLKVATENFQIFTGCKRAGREGGRLEGPDGPNERHICLPIPLSFPVSNYYIVNGAMKPRQSRFAETVARGTRVHASIRPASGGITFSADKPVSRTHTHAHTHVHTTCSPRTQSQKGYS